MDSTKEKNNMSDPANLAAFMARIDERTMNMTASMIRLEASFEGYQNAVDQRFKDLMRDVIAPIQTKLEKNTVSLAVYTAGGGLTGAGIMAMLLKAMQSWPH